MFCYQLAIRIASLWSKKARLWVEGRKNILDMIRAEVDAPKAGNIWIHCSSLGEFEQGRPVIEQLKASYPDSKIVLTFFSPSGYEIRKDYKGVDWVFYLPLDSNTNAKRFFDVINPSLVIFVKYDYWYYYLNECKKRNIPLLMVSAIFRRQQAFFKWYGGFYRKMLSCFTHFFVQDDQSYELLRSINISNTTVAGDTRFDRVSAIAEKFSPIAEIEEFTRNAPVLVAGSTWPGDEKIIKEAIRKLSNLKIIIAPHEIHETHLQKLRFLFPDAIFHSELTRNLPLASHKYLIIDNIGMLSRLYYYGTITYVGGGFNKGIHNTLEAAVYAKPVLFGPNYKKFREAIGLIESGGGTSVASASELANALNKLLTDKKLLEQGSKKSFDFVNDNRGATEKIIQFIQENRRFTS